MKIIPESHTDHSITPSQLEWLLGQLADRRAFTIETLELPASLGTVPCGLHGPAMGDEPVPSVEVTLSPRGKRDNLSRLCDRAPRQTRYVTVIGGPHGDEPCVLYTAFGGPLSPKEPTDPTLTEDEREKSIAFWSEHALSR